MANKSKTKNTVIILVFAKNCIREDDNENVVADEKDDNEVC